MKKVVLNYLVIAVLAISTALVSSCGGGSGSSGGGKSSGKIKITTEEGGSFIFYLTGSGVATVDWGDGSEKVMLTLNESGVRFEHSYPNMSLRTVTINGDNITGFNCPGSYDLISLDVSRCTELRTLSCDVMSPNIDVSKNTALTTLIVAGGLISLDVSKNTALTSLYCGDNKLTSSALNDLFRTLHSNTLTNTRGDGWGGTVEENKNITISNNPGSADCDRSIAEAKGWEVRN